MKILVVHQGKRDEYQVAHALVESGHEVFLVTSGYCNFIVPILAKIIPIGMFKKLASRKCEVLHNKYISSGLINELLARLVGSVLGESFALEWIDKSISKRALSLIRNENIECVVCYNYNAFRVFASLKNSSCIKILFQCHPHPLLILEDFKTAAIAGFFSSKNNEKEFSYSLGYQAMLIAECHLADMILCASSFTKKSLQRAGVFSDSISVHPYGVGAEYGVGFNKNMSDYNVMNRPLKIIFVGQFVYRKGLLIIDAILNRIDFPLEMIFVGRGNSECEPGQTLFKDNINIRRYWNIPKKELLSLYAEADVFLFPSIIEGFAQVIIEAMKAGCVPVVSSSTCGTDVIENGLSGFVHDPFDVDSFVNSLVLLRDVNKLDLLRKNAMQRATEFTWGSFRVGVAQVVARSIGSKFNLSIET